MHSGIERRTSRVFAADGRSVMLAFDHGLWGDRSGGMADPEKTLREGVAAGVDAVLTSVGNALRFGAAIDRVGLVLSLDRAQGDPRAAVDEALGLGADMVKAMCFPGSKDLRSLSSCSAARHAWMTGVSSPTSRRRWVPAQRELRAAATCGITRRPRG